MLARDATPADAEAIAHIYNQAIAERTSTFETRARTAVDIAGWLGGMHPVIVMVDNDLADAAVIGYGATFPYSDRACYRGVAEFSVYVDRDHRGRGVGKLALGALYQAARKAGLWKLVSRIFPENAAVRRLNSTLGIREVGVHEKHGELDGVWRDVIVVEWLIRENIGQE
jgi:L-amino acid N-acyltransferase YncA